MRRTAARALRLLATCLLVAAAAAPARGEAHPFYEQLLREGIYSLAGGDAAAAEQDLRLAAFGLLDEPPRLVVALAHLAVAQAAAGHTAALDETLQRLLTVEQRFTVFAAAEMAPTVRARLEELLLERAPEAGLATAPGFRDLGEEKVARRIAALPPAQQRTALAAQVERQPDEPRWQLLLGELELAAGQQARAASFAGRALALSPGPREETAARCLRGKALAALGSCAPAVADLELCPQRLVEPAVAEALLSCHAQLGQWRQAVAFAATLPADLRRRRDLSRLASRAEREAARLPAPAPVERGAALEPTQAPPAAAGAPAAENGAQVPPAAAAPASPLPATAQQQLAEARRLMAAARRASDLATPLNLAAAVADAHRDSVDAQHLAAEIAYRSSRWTDAVRYFRRGGEPRGDSELLFYYAVSLWESGEREEAADRLRLALPRLSRTPFVEDYVQRILGPG